MFLLNTKITTKNLVSLKKFLHLLLKFGVRHKKKFLNFLVLKTLNLKCSQPRKIITILTSPQANKNAQEQFLFKKYFRNILLFSFTALKILIILKKIKMCLFSEIKIQLNFLYSKKKIKNVTKKIFNPENFFIKIVTKNNQKKIFTSNNIKKNSTKSKLAKSIVYGKESLQAIKPVKTPSIKAPQQKLWLLNQKNVRIRKKT